MDPFQYGIFGRSCPPCPPVPPCNCQPNEQCQSVLRGCDTCGSFICVPIDDTDPGTKHGVSAGALAGAVIASVIFLAVVILAALWYRRRLRERTATPTPIESKPTETPARADEVLNRPDPHKEKPQAPEPHTVRIYGGPSSTTINLDPESSHSNSVAATNGHTRTSVQSNPFTDTQSIQSASTGTRSNMIPIAFVPPGSVSVRSDQPSTQATAGSGPKRPERSPDMDLSLHSSPSPADSGPATSKNYAKSAKSGMTAWRNSYMTTGSFASDLLNEAPVIITPTRGTVKQVVGVVRAEVIRTPPSSSSVYSGSESDSLRTASSTTSRPPLRSPLAVNAYGPLEAMLEEQEHERELSIRSNPFSDEHSPYLNNEVSASTGLPSPAPTSATFGESEQQHWDAQSPRLPWTRSSPRPSSVNTQAASIISANIGTASRVHLGLNQLSPQRVPPGRELLAPPSSDLPHTPISAPLSTARSQYRMTSAKIISPPIGSADSTPALPGGALERQQKRALEELDRMSRASVVSSASTRADSILEGFPFVPPSPISDRPIRTPPRSPLAQQAFNTPSTQSSKTVQEEELPLSPPNRKLLGMSTGSQLSTMSNGLGSFPFQIDSGNGPETPDSVSSAPSSFSDRSGRQRASLDTLALTSDLSSYPLGFDRGEAMAHYPGSRRS